MPARNEYGNKKKKKKGRAPAHQNKFAFQHNPCSKKTEKILNLQNVHVCQKCSDKIVWRKQYRKYKPRTQPGVCNGCKKRNVKAAYHTICAKCTTESVKAKQLIAQAIADSPELEEERTVVRACAVCVKVIALPDPEEEEDDREYIDAMSRLKLRERRALERQMWKEEEPEEDEDNGDDNNKNGGGEESENNDTGEGPQQQPRATQEEVPEEGNVVSDDSEGQPDYGDDEDDPFLKAIGGADKLLTGKAYQRELLEQQRQQAA